MAYRQIHTQIWKDEWFLDLEPQEKLLFIYLFSNDNTTLAGIYKISLRVIEFETGLNMQFIKSTLDKFAAVKKVLYQDGLIWVINLMRYNASSGSPKVKICIEKELQQIPDCELKIQYLTGNIGYPYHIDTLSLINNNNNNNNNITDQIIADQSDDDDDEERPNIFEWYENEVGMITPLIADKLKLIEGEYPSDWILKAFKVAAGNNARNINYIEACLKNMRDKGVDWKPGGNGAGKKKEEVKSADYISGQYAGFIEH